MDIIIVRDHKGTPGGMSETQHLDEQTEAQWKVLADLGLELRVEYMFTGTKQYTIAFKGQPTGAALGMALVDANDKNPERFIEAVRGLVRRVFDRQLIERA